ncbi:hypothetical protein Y032_0766g2168 [Ancylostoma ceylanicum]|uniref:Uncharacterized protein n=1 Tax=Ancylostoma ceylanicum TaxID=53326 RepID=A0A016WEP7_9BILA|nr:hypothetical protein Y032_0766g2168 [Ancylostoma ceylanicum]
MQSFRSLRRGDTGFDTYRLWARHRSRWSTIVTYPKPVSPSHSDRKLSMARGLLQQRYKKCPSRLHPSVGMPRRIGDAARQVSAEVQS